MFLISSILKVKLLCFKSPLVILARRVYSFVVVRFRIVFISGLANVGK